MAVYFHIIPSSKCILRQPNFQNFAEDHAPASPKGLARVAHSWFVSSLDRTLPEKNQLTGLYSNCSLYSCLKTFFKLIIN